MMSPAALAAVAALCAASLAGSSDATEAGILRDGSPFFELWKSPPVKPQLRLYIFNLTNAYGVLNGEKPIVDEVGPYVFDQTWLKEEIVFNEDDTVSYKQNKISTFNRDESVGGEDDMVVIPNLKPLIFSQAASSISFPDNFYDLLTLNLVRDRVLPFIEVPVGQFLHGFRDPHLQTTGTSGEVVTVFTGASDITRTGLVDRYDGKSSLEVGQSEECNRIDGSDGSIFPPHITKNTTLYFFSDFSDMERRLPLEFLQEVETSNGAHLYRFTPPKRTFADAPQKPAEDNCFSASGLMQVRWKSEDVGLAISFPHFFLGDPKLREAVGDMIEPDPEKHMFYVDVDPITGVTVNARFRVQLNFAVNRIVRLLTGAPEVVLPIFWFEESFDGVPVPSQEQLQQASKAMASS